MRYVQADILLHLDLLYELAAFSADRPFCIQGATTAIGSSCLVSHIENRPVSEVFQLSFSIRVQIHTQPVSRVVRNAPRLTSTPDVQVDHTKADVFIVDEETRLPIGRAWLTLAMDVSSRMVTGFYLTMEAPSRLSTSLCYYTPSLTNHPGYVSAKSWNRGWLPACRRQLHVNNGSDFRSRAFQRGCEDAGIAINWRFSNAQELGEYDSKQHSALTLRELERYIALYIVGTYH